MENSTKEHAYSPELEPAGTPVEWNLTSDRQCASCPHMLMADHPLYLVSIESLNHRGRSAASARAS